jgi:DinB superfamily
MPTHTPAADAVERMTTAATAIDALRGPIEVGPPWPVRAVQGEGPEAEWGAPEVLAHVAEMLQYWLGEVERVLAGAPEPVPFGRIASDPLRTLTIERDRSLPSGELINRIQSTVARYAARLPGLSAADWNRRGLHPRVGEMTVAAMLERFVVTHLEEHATQLTEAVRSRAAAS